MHHVHLSHITTLDMREGDVTSRPAPRGEAETLSVTEAAALLGIGRDLAYRAAARGEIPTVRIGRRLLIPRHQLTRMLRGDTPTNTPKQGGARK